MANGDDVFHVVGFTREDVSSGALFRVMRLSDVVLNMMMKLHQIFGALNTAVERGHVTRQQVEVYFLMPEHIAGILSSQTASKQDLQAFRQRIPEEYFNTYFFNDTALRLCQQYGIQIPKVIGRLKRSELPSHMLGTIMQFDSFEITS